MKSKEDSVTSNSFIQYIDTEPIYIALQTAARVNTFVRSRKPKMVYGDVNGSSGNNQQVFGFGRDDSPISSNNKGLGILSNNTSVNAASSATPVGTGGIRNGMASLGLTNTGSVGDSSNNNTSGANSHVRSSTNATGSTAGRMMARRTRR